MKSNKHKATKWSTSKVTEIYFDILFHCTKITYLKHADDQWTICRNFIKKKWIYYQYKFILIIDKYVISYDALTEPERLKMNEWNHFETNRKKNISNRLNRILLILNFYRILFSFFYFIHYEKITIVFTQVKQIEIKMLE